MKLLVLGASSQLGREISALLKSQGVACSALASSEIDLLRQMEVVKAVTRIDPTQVVNVASYSNLEKAESDPDSARECDIINSRGVSILAEVCKHLNLPLIHHSSSYVFDGTKKSPYTEDDQSNPVSRYGMSKWYGERAIRETLERHIILRTDWMFSVHRNKFIKMHIEACKKQQGHTQVMNHRFSPTPADDVARVVLAIARQIDCEAQVWGTYHYGALQPLSQAQFVETILREACQYDSELSAVVERLDIEVVPVKLPYIANTMLSCQKIMETFGIKQRSRAAGIAAVLEDIYHPGRVAQKQQSVSPGSGKAPETKTPRK
ncbi:MAG: sugar nucleotide-binding protein, partial [Pseudohongiellaceae bacterium]